MSQNRSFFLLCALLALWLPGNGSAAGPTSILATGDRISELTLEDQHGNTHTLPADARLVLFTSDKAASSVLQDYLAQRDADFLRERQAHFVADISRMPGLVTRMFALPSMRERPYPILLAYAAEDVAQLPRREGQVSVLRIDQRRITDVAYATSGAQLDALLGQPRP
jgi:hypothetical protein